MRPKIQRVAASMLDYLDRRLGRHSGNGPEFTFDCPACIDRTGSEARKKKLAVHLDKRKGRCFRCEFKFREIEHLFRYVNGGFLTPEERILLREDPPIVIGSVRETVLRVLFGEEQSEDKPLRVQPLPRAYVPLSLATETRPGFKRAHHYLRSRHVSLKKARRFQIGFCTRGEYAGYLIFPVVQNGEVVYWTSRYAGNHRLKSNNPPKRDGFYSRQHCLLNYDNAIGHKIVALVEGPFDCTAPPHAIGLMGRVMSPFQAKLIAQLVPHGLRELVLMLDPGTGGDMDHVREQLVDVVPKITMLTLDHGDPASRKAELPLLLPQRREPTLLDRIKSRISTK